MTQEKKDWKSFFDGIPCDAPNPKVVSILEKVRNTREDIDIIITTARPARWGVHSVIWLAEHNIEYTEMFMRQDGDHRSDDVVKAEMYREHIEPKWEVLFAIDDRPMVCDTWESLGLDVVRITDPALDPIMEGPKW